MKLTREEYAMFNLNSRIAILDNHGVMLMEKLIGADYTIKLFLLYDFYVEVFYCKQTRAAIKAEPVWFEKFVNLFYF